MADPGQLDHRPDGAPDVAEQFATGGWAFTDEVAGVFPAHVRASVPHYDQIQDLIAQTTDWLVPHEGRVADLGAATGTTCCKIAARHPHRFIGFDLYDESQAMLDIAEKNLRPLPGGGRCLFHCTRIQAGPLHHLPADLTLILFTLQFLPPAHRVAALKLARQHAAPTGALIVAEKIRPRDTRWAEIANDVSHDWKADHGITDTAIRAKARALRGVLIPATEADLTAAIRAAGWTRPETLFRWHQWTVTGAYATR